MKRIITWLALVIVVGLIVWGMIVANRKDGVTSAGRLSTPVSAADHSVGSSSKMVVVEYSDFQCPACGSYEPIVEQLLKEYGKEFTFVYRHFPLTTIHQNALLGALASEAASNQGKFWEMHDMLFKYQDQWSVIAPADSKEIVVGYAKTLGLDVSKFETDLASETLVKKVNEDYKAGVRSGVNSTPTFFVNGSVISNPRSYEEFVKIIQSTSTPAY